MKKARLNILLDRVVATDRHMLRMKRQKDLEKHIVARQAVHDLFAEESKRITNTYWEDRT